MNGCGEHNSYGDSKGGRGGGKGEKREVLMDGKSYIVSGKGKGEREIWERRKRRKEIYMQKKKREGKENKEKETRRKMTEEKNRKIKQGKKKKIMKQKLRKHDIKGRKRWRERRKGE